MHVAAREVVKFAALPSFDLFVEHLAVEPEFVEAAIRILEVEDDEFAWCGPASPPQAPPSLVNSPDDSTKITPVRPCALEMRPPLPRNGSRPGCGTHPGSGIGHRASGQTSTACLILPEC